MLEKNINRYLTIMTNLFKNEDRLLSIESACDLLNISSKTLKTDIENINYILREKTLEVSSNNILYLISNNNIGLKQIFKKILKSSSMVNYFYSNTIKI
ncbi:helix-turn-helix domain-containing protein [Enterococcus sp. AZ012]|uniref:helix-turn-helix domain-containing protein n=1 Tax=Enterococcus sp. AZ012 TaxID=2774682 RepID=UPI003D2855BC